MDHQNRATSGRVFLGFLCERNARFAKIFSCNSCTLIEIPLSTPLALELCQFYRVCHQSWKVRNAREMYGRNVAFFIHNGQVHARSWSISRKQEEKMECEEVKIDSDDDEDELEDGELEDEKEETQADVWRRNQGNIWSQFLGFLHDPNSLYPTDCETDERVDVIVRYAPREYSTFEIVRIEKRHSTGQLTVKPPWQMEIFGNHQRPLHARDMFSTRSQISCSYFVQNALCLTNYTVNPHFNAKAHGSKKYCSLFFHVKFGVYKCMDPNAQTGCWYQTKFNDTRRKKTNEVELFRAVNAASIKQTTDKLQTRIVREKLMIDTKFILSNITMSGDGEQWASFCDKILGPISVTTDCLNEIRKNVKTYTKASTKEKYKPSETMFEVGVTVQLLDNYCVNIELYPTRGFFKVVSVETIKHLSDDFPFWRK